MQRITFHRRMTGLLLFLPWLVLSANPVLAEDRKEKCMSAIRHILEQKEMATGLGGLWSGFDRTEELSKHLTIALQLDKNLLLVEDALNYLCRTMDGVPLTEVPLYVRDGLAEAGGNEAKFREKMIDAGRDLKVDRWLAYSKKAFEWEHRKLDMVSVEATIKKAAPFFEEWLAIIQLSPQAGKSAEVLARSKKLAAQVDEFFAKDENAVRSVEEQKQEMSLDAAGMMH